VWKIINIKFFLLYQSKANLAIKFEKKLIIYAGKNSISKALAALNARKISLDIFFISI